MSGESFHLMPSKGHFTFNILRVFFVCNYGLAVSSTSFTSDLRWSFPRSDRIDHEPCPRPPWWRGWRWAVRPRSAVSWCRGSRGRPGSEELSRARAGRIEAFPELVWRVEKDSASRGRRLTLRDWDWLLLGGKGEKFDSLRIESN